MSGKLSFIMGGDVTHSTAKLVTDGNHKAIDVHYETSEKDDRRLRVMVYWVLQAAGRAVVECETMSEETLAKIEAEMQEKSIHHVESSER